MQVHAQVYAQVHICMACASLESAAYTMRHARVLKHAQAEHRMCTLCMCMRMHASACASVCASAHLYGMCIARICSIYDAACTRAQTCTGRALATASVLRAQLSGTGQRQRCLLPSERPCIVTVASGESDLSGWWRRARRLYAAFTASQEAPSGTSSRDRASASRITLRTGWTHNACLVSGGITKWSRG